MAKKKKAKKKATKRKKVAKKTAPKKKVAKKKKRKKRAKNRPDTELVDAKVKRKRSFHISDNPELLDFVADRMMTVKSRHKLKTTIRDWVTVNFPARSRLHPETVETIISKARPLYLSRFETVFVNAKATKDYVQHSLVDVVEDEATPPIVRVRGLEAISDVTGVGAKYQGIGELSPENKAERMRRALIEIEDSVTLDESKGESKDE